MSSTATAIPFPIPAAALPRAQPKTKTPARTPARKGQPPMAAEESDPVQADLPRARDNLEDIEGIGSTYAEALYKHGIDRFADLAGRTPAGLVELLKDDCRGLSAARIVKDDWIGQAMAFAKSTAKPQSAPQGAERSEESPPTFPTRKSRERWLEVADFHVSYGYVGNKKQEHFKTRAHHWQADTPMEWNGLATDELLAWMLKQAKLSPPKEADAESAPAAKSPPAPSPAPDAPDGIQLEILEVQNPRIGSPIGAWSGSLETTVRFCISGRKSKALAEKSVPYRVETFLVGHDTGEPILASVQQGRLAPGEFDYTVELAFLVPQAMGDYEMHTTVLLFPPFERMASYIGPGFTVVP